MKELSPAPIAVATAEVPVAEGEQLVQPVAEVPVEAPKRPRFASIHTLLMCIDKLADLVSGVVYIRNDAGVYEAKLTSKIPTADLIPLIEAGRVGVPWDHRYLEFDELGPEWPRGVRSATQVQEQAQVASLTQGAPAPAPAPAPEQKP